MLSKESKIRVLENFHAIDYVFFGKPVKEVTTCCPLVKEEYLSVKGALMSVYIEMLKLIAHKPEAIGEAVDSKQLFKNARSAAVIARENSQKIVSSDKARKNIKEMLKEEVSQNPDVDVNELVEKAIRNKAFGLAIDNLLIARTIRESEDVSSLNEWEGQIIEDSYKILRDSLVEAAYAMLYEEDEADEEEGGGEPDEIEEFIDRDRGGKKGGFGSIGGKSTSGGFGSIGGKPKKESEEVEEGMVDKVKNKQHDMKCKAVRKDIASFVGFNKKCRDKYKGNPEKIKKCIDDWYKKMKITLDEL